MGFLKRFFRNVFRDGAAPIGTSSFEQLSEADLEAHLGVSRDGDFTLTEAIRPSYDLQVVPRQGYRHDMYHDADNRCSVPVLMGAASPRNCSKSSWTCSIRWDPRSTSCSRRAITASARSRRPVSRAHRHAGSEEHSMGL